MTRDDDSGVTRGLIDIELDLVYTPAEMDLPSTTGGEDDPLVQRLGRPEYERRRAESERRHAERCPIHSPLLDPVAKAGNDPS